MQSPAIVVVAYDRPKSLERLLNSIAKAKYPNEEIILHISIDHSTNHEVTEVANNFEWNRGKKIVDVHPKRLGLKQHVLQCGDLTQKYDAIIMLEDDLYVAPNFYGFAHQSLEFYDKDPKVAGISLYSYAVCESYTLPFKPIKYDCDTYFIQFASSWGQGWTKGQWSAFKDWLVNSERKTVKTPHFLKQWSEESWKKEFIMYLIACDLYVSFPYESYTSLTKESGTHMKNEHAYNVPLSLSFSNPIFENWEKSKAIYDVYFEPTRETILNISHELKEYRFDIDLYGQKNQNELKNELVLTTRKATNSILGFRDDLSPLLLNLLNGEVGDSIKLVNAKDVNWSLNEVDAHLNTAVLKRWNKLNARSVGVIFPFEDDKIEELEDSIKSLENNSVEIEIVVVSRKDVDTIKDRTNTLNTSVTLSIISINENEDLLCEGLKHLKADIVTWCEPGTIFIDGVLDKMDRIFTRYGEVAWVKGLNVNMQKEKINNYRLSQKFVKNGIENHSESTTDCAFIRMSDIAKATGNFTLRPSFQLLLESTKLYIADIHVTTSPSNSAVEFKGYKGANPIQKILRFFFAKNVKWLRFIYLEKEHLPELIRYNSDEDFFYLSRF